MQSRITFDTQLKIALIRGMPNTKDIVSYRATIEIWYTQFDQALNIGRSELLKKNVKPDKIVFPLVLDYNPVLPDIQRVIKKNVNLLSLSPELLENFPPKSIFPAYRRTKNLKDIFAHSKFCADRSLEQAQKEMGGCFKCS